MSTELLVITNVDSVGPKCHRNSDPCFNHVRDSVPCSRPDPDINPGTNVNLSYDKG